MGLEYDVTEWSFFFINSRCRSLKADLLYNGNSFPSIPIWHSVQTKETHNSMDHLLSVVNYKEHKWMICGDLKVVGLVLGFQGGYATYPCSLCLSDCQADEQHYVIQDSR